MSGRSGADGRFALEAPPGDFELSARASGFSVARAQVRLPGDAAAEVQLSLQPGVFTEEVTVVGTRLAGSAETLERLPGSVDVARPPAAGDLARGERERGASQGDRRQRPRRGGPRAPAQHRDPGPEPHPLLEDAAARGRPVRHLRALWRQRDLLPPPRRALRGDRGREGIGPDRLRPGHGGRRRQLPHAGAAREADGQRAPGGGQPRLLERPGARGRHLGQDGGARRVHAEAGRRRAGQPPLARGRREPEGGLHPRPPPRAHPQGQLLRRGLADHLLGPHPRRVGGGPAPEPVPERRLRRLAPGRLGAPHLARRQRERPHHPGLRLALQPRLVAPVEQLRPAPQRPRRPRLRRHGQPAHHLRKRGAPARLRPLRGRAAPAHGAPPVRPAQRGRGRRPRPLRGPGAPAGERRHAARARAAGWSRTTGARTRPSRPSSRTGCCSATSR